MKPKDEPDKVLKETVEKTIDVVADYVRPGPRNDEETIEKVIETVDSDQVKAAVKTSDQLEEDTRRAMNSQHPERDNQKADQDEPGPKREERRDRAAGND
jgi:hypothetical protein